MKIKRVLQVGIPILLIVCVVVGICLSIIPGPDRTSSSGVKAKHQGYTSSDDSDWEVVTGENILLENDRVSLDFDAATGHFILTDKRSGYAYPSYVENAESFAIENVERMQSEMTLLYYDTSSKAQYLTAVQSVDKGNFVVKRKGNTIRVYYVFGTDSSAIFAPPAFTKETFENVVLPGLASDSDRRRFKMEYRLYSKAEGREDFNEKLAQYPILAEQDLYLLIDTETPATLRRVTGYMKKSSYTKEDYEAEKAAIGISDDMMALPVGFEVPVEYTLEEDGFSATVLSDKIRENNDTDVLQQILLLEYFGYCGADKEGYMLVPDGSGALIDINKREDQVYSQHLFNEDDAIVKTEQEELSRNVPLPVFGYNQGDNAFFTVIESGAAMATVTANTIGSANSQNHVFSAFDVRGMDITNIGEDRHIDAFNLYANHIAYEFPKVRYMVLTGEESSYSGMANRYRQYLLDTSVLTQRLSDGDMPLYLDFSGILVEDANILGIPYQKKTALSTFESIQAVARRLQEADITNLQIRLKGYGSAGLNHAFFDRLDVSNKMGSMEQLVALAEGLKQSGGRLYLDTDFNYVYTDGSFDGFKAGSDGAKRMDRSVASLSGFNPVTLEFETQNNYRMAVSPSIYRYLAGAFFGSVDKQLKDNKSLFGFSWSTGGEYITSDFSKKVDYDLSMSKDAVRETMEFMAGNTDSLLTDYGNIYTLPYVSGILNMPLTSSGYHAETRSVPFYQMAVHGYVDFTGSPDNRTYDREGNLLNTAECGASLYYDWITADDRLMMKTDYATQRFSMNVEKSFDRAVETYQRYNQVFSGLRSQTIVNHEMLDGNVTVTTYENGTRIAVNYGFSEAQVNGQTIGARDFAVLN